MGSHAITLCYEEEPNTEFMLHKYKRIIKSKFTVSNTLLNGADAP